MITYLLKSGILLFVFYAVYKLWLENEKMLRFNRAYLLLSLFFSLVIPLQLVSFQSVISNETGIVQLNELVIQKGTENLSSISVNDFIIGLILSIYVFIVSLFAIRFFVNLYSFYKKTRRSKVLVINDEKIVLLQETVLPHSFLNTIFINKEEFEKGKIPSELIAHEKAHLQQKHTLDLLFIEMLQIVFWFNPLLVFYKKAIKLNHEFLADEAVNVQFKSVENYQKLLLDFALNKNTVALASNINYLITKKRLLMMTKKESPIKVVLKICTVSIVGTLLLLVFSSRTIAQTEKSSPKLKEGFAISYDTTSVKGPEFPGGMVEFYKFIGKNFKMPAEASKNKIEGKVLMEFMVEKDGSLSEIKIIKDLGNGLGDEATRVLKLSPKWNPATQEGKPVRVTYALPITIKNDK
ncbi:energy transducer TonB [Flavobacterium sp. ENC]|uniref:M56 family metallopeptidase n=1 Tax=Flavobacterium sp. ENC TaxID=2897330 RepID=UPI001E2D1D05|nr:M56 family metallopeptidase [Flavobacterium sp. ENC]MCD0464057.1 M56 family metallopeptidase [Flavobacterium sp. ENC]